MFKNLTNVKKIYKNKNNRSLSLKRPASGTNIMSIVEPVMWSLFMCKRTNNHNFDDSLSSNISELRIRNSI